MNPSETASLDQFRAFANDLLASNGLALVDTTSIEPLWLAEHTADELWDLLLTAAVKAGSDAQVMTIIAMELPTGVTACGLALAKKADP